MSCADGHVGTFKCARSLRRISTIRAEDGKVPPANIMAVAALAFLGPSHYQYPGRCPDYAGILLFTEPFDSLQPDDYELLRHAHTPQRA